MAYRDTSARLGRATGAPVVDNLNIETDNGFKNKPEGTIGLVKANALADREPHFHAGNFCSVVRNSPWAS